MATIGENIKRARLASQFKTQSALAKEMGEHQSRISDWERDRYDAPDVSSLLKVAKVLKVSIDSLIEGLDPEYDQARRDPLRPKSKGQSPRIEKRGSRGATARLLQREAAHQQDLDAVYEVAKRLLELSGRSAASEAPVAPPKEPAHRRRHRTAS